MKNKLYVEFCDPFDEKHENFWMKIEHFARYMFFIDNIENKNATVGDFACSNGYGSYEIAKECKKIYAYDVNSKYINEAKSKNNANNIEYKLVNLNNKFCTDNALDYISCFETLEHLDKPYEFLKNLYDLLKYGGKCFISFPNKKYESIDAKGKCKDIYHKNVFDVEEVLWYLEKIGFKVEKVLGQSIVNIILHNEYKLIKKNKYSYNEFIDKYKYDNETIKYFSRIMAYPSDFCIDESYSYIIVLSKN